MSYWNLGYMKTTALESGILHLVFRILSFCFKKIWEFEVYQAAHVEQLGVAPVMSSRSQLFCFQGMGHSCQLTGIWTEKTGVNQ